MKKEEKGVGSDNYLSQSDLPRLTLEKALKIATAIKGYGKTPTKPLRIAQALGIRHTTGYFRSLCGASIGYGLTTGGYNADVIKITPLGERVVAPKEVGQDLQAKREAVLRPRIIKDFLNRYDQDKLPPETYLHNVLEDMGIPNHRVKEALEIITENAKSVGFFVSVGGQMCVDLSASMGDATMVEEPDGGFSESEQAVEADAELSGQEPPATLPELVESDGKLQKVFLSHGKNTSLLDQIKEFVSLTELEPVVSVENQSVSQPVPKKVLEEMRKCGAAVIQIDAEKVIKDEQGKDTAIINPNVLIEIGVAMALYGERFVLLVQEGVELPSNLQGLLRVPYAGEELDGKSVIKLLQAIKDIKRRSLPGEL